jgi:predicted kinase
MTTTPRRPTAHLIHGYLAVGKTTFARRLSLRTGAVLLSADEWYLRLYTDGTPTGHLDNELYRRLESQLDELWPQILSHGVDMVLDFGFWTRSLRDRTRRLATAAGATVVLHSVTCSEQIARQRLAARNEDPCGSFLIPDGAYDHLRSKFTALDADEPHVNVTESTDP